MDEKKFEFAFPTLLLITGFCFISFTLVLRVLEAVNTRFFLWFGLITFMTGILTGTLMWFRKKAKQRSIS